MARQNGGAIVEFRQIKYDSLDFEPSLHDAPKSAWRFTASTCTHCSRRLRRPVTSRLCHAPTPHEARARSTVRCLSCCLERSPPQVIPSLAIHTREQVLDEFRYERYLPLVVGERCKMHAVA
jgi:hypothetical protein